MAISGIFALLLIFGIGMFFLHIFICIWAYRDAVRRGKSQEFAVIVLLAVLVFPVIGLIVYLIIRND